MIQYRYPPDIHYPVAHFVNIPKSLGSDFLVESVVHPGQDYKMATGFVTKILII